MTLKKLAQIYQTDNHNNFHQHINHDFQQRNNPNLTNYNIQFTFA